ncbi:MAG: hypothetical protein IPN76_16420 [Saprospiraceae bacterium]|nr:hypothetical protein [Saprospiraceae bacterium]
MNYWNKILAALSLLSLPFMAFSQKYWEIGLTPGAMVYYGDLTVPHVTFKETHLGGQLNIKRYFDREHALRMNVLHGTIAGSDYNYDRNSDRGNEFVGRLTEFSLMGELDLKGRKRYSKKMDFQRTLSPYIMAGIAGAYCKPEVTYGQPENKDLAVEYPAWHFALPVGGGVKMDLSEHIFLGAELGLRVTLSDYLDGTQASGNAYKNDSYAFGGLTMGYRFLKFKKTVSSF